MNTNPEKMSVNENAGVSKYSIKFSKNDITKEISDSSVILIDGISLITDCFLNHEMNLFHGGQYLHFVYLFERFIDILLDLTEHFFIVFFEDLNIYFEKDKSLNLAIGIILNHLVKIKSVKGRLRFFDNFLSKKYQSFLDEKKPTFIALNELTKFNKLKINKKQKDEIKNIYQILPIYHIGKEINILVLNEMIIESNRLVAFYAQPNTGTRKKFAKLNIYDDLLKAFRTKQIKEEKKYDFLVKISSDFRKEAENLSKIKGDKLTIYLLSLLNCFFKKRPETDDLQFTRFAILAILNVYLTENLDLRTRSIRLKHKIKIIDSHSKHLLNILKDSLAFIIGSKAYEYIDLKPKTISDLFDGRIFSFTWLLVQTEKINWSAILDDKLCSDLNDCFIFLSQSITKLDKKDAQFNQIVNLGTCDPTREEMYLIFEQVFPKIFTLKKIESKFFKIKNQNFNLKINCIQHQLIEALIEKMCDKNEIKWKTDNESESMEKSVEQFMAKNKWSDNFKTIKSVIRTNIESDGISNEIIKTLNIYSLESNNFLSRYSEKQIDLKQLDSLIRNKHYLEMEKILSIYPETFQNDYIYLENVFKVVRKLSKKSKFTENYMKNFIFLKLTKNLFSKMDTIWSKIASNQRLDNLVEMLTIMITILDFYQFNNLKNQVMEYISQKFKRNLLVLDSTEHFNHNLSEHRFQLLILEEILQHQRISVQDKRTKLFVPDEWQVEFLDAVDKRESMLIVAPTSSGKTFASFYAMEQVVKSNDDSILIYVSPTKALANQTSFGIMKRFEGYKPNSGKKLCGVFSRDFRQNLFDCKILVTVPQCLFILLLNFYHTEWPKNIKYIVFDEIHSLSGEKTNDIWEYLLLLIKCPFIALSATIGQPERFHQWLINLERSKSPAFTTKRKVRLIHYKESHSDVKRFLFTNKDLRKINPLGCICYSNLVKYFDLPGDINLLPSEILDLYDELEKTRTIDVTGLNPDNNNILKKNLNFSLLLTRNSVKEYGNILKQKLVEYVLEHKKKCFFDNFKIKFQEKELYPSYTIIEERNRSFKEMILKMFERDMLPAIVFCNNRILCQEMANYLANNDINFNPDYEDHKVDLLIDELAKDKQIDAQFLNLIEHGIGWHHSGMSPNLKSIVEALFRVGKLRVVFATATLALGIHMPCKSVVFMDDQIYLDSFQYRQAYGRAGRRGYDQVGYVVFFDIPHSKINRLMGSYIPELRPHFPLSVTFTMQLFDCVLKSKNRVNLSIDCVLFKSYWNFTYSRLNQVGYYAIFSLNFLFDLKLLNEKGKFSTFANILERIHYHEPSNLLFYFMMVNNLFHDLISKNSGLNESKKMEKIMTIMCYLFNRISFSSPKKKIALPKLDKKSKH
ncbi:putative ATP-dependent RNA helicase DDX60 [Brachionus plicatilis]|uniref:Putative ATP-dependent RNA helicase DDX60 n=1 Tax=Brachionus plicatilis TaxID=10195 RepID=A0A3M7RA14_BRAPC|nr:putative ATP-dependent RNA helicase DDX60 [Brachionus plicatilis]